LSRNDALELHQKISGELFKKKLHKKLHKQQLELRDFFYNSNSRKVVFNCSRRFGKSTLLAVLAVEHCCQIKNARVVFAAPTREQAKDIIVPIIRDLFDDAPEHVKPKYQSQERVYRFDNGSEIHIDGADDEQGNHLRGPKATLVLCDEAGFWRHCDYVINSVLLPQTITCNGRIIIASTPPQSVGHEFIKFVEDSIRNESYCVKTIHDNPMVNEELIEEYATESGGHNSTTFRREYLCEFVTDSERAIVPEFSDENIFEYYKRPLFYDAYVFMDLGLVDLTHVLFAYYDFENAKLIIEDEVVQNYKTTAEIADLIKAKESELWESKSPTLRVADNEMQQLIDLCNTYGLVFSPASKYDKEAAINQMRKLIQDKKILISKKCKNLIHQLKVGIWNKSRTDYERIPGAGHLDGLDALKYGIRIVDFNKNPVPINYGYNWHEQGIRRGQSTFRPGMVRKHGI
jgi:PBSX family phage terminase large subunit